MQGRIFAGFLLCSLFFVVGGDAQSPDKPQKVWTLEFIKVRPENFGPAMGYLDDHWMRVRAEAKRQGIVLDYHRIQNAAVTPGLKVGDPGSIVLLTEYRSLDAYTESQMLFVDLMKERTHFQIGGVIRPGSTEALFETLNTQVFVEEPDTTSGFKLLTKQ